MTTNQTSRMGPKTLPIPRCALELDGEQRRQEHDRDRNDRVGERRRRRRRVLPRRKGR